MIEINLLPGARKRKRSGLLEGLPIGIPDSMPEMDRMALFIAAAWIIGPVLVLWLYLGTQGEIDETRVALDQAVADSIRFASVIETQTRLRARQDTIAQKLEMIQEIDAGRYVWPHIMDELSRALPPFTWLDQISAVDTNAPTPTFEIQGRTGSLPALTRYMDALEGSPFLRNIQLISSEQSTVGNDPNKVVNNFILTGAYEVPPLDVVETVPLFEEGADSAVAGEVTDGTGTS